MYSNLSKTFMAGEALLAARLVKIKSGTTTDPPEVEYADAGEACLGVTEYDVASGDPINIRLLNNPGTFEVTAIVSSAIARGTLLYAANDGKVSDASTGSVVGVALQTAASGAIIEVAIHPRTATTAAGTSIVYTGTFTAAATVEAALAELYQDMFSVQQFLPIPLNTLREATAFAVGNVEANGGVLASNTTPILAPINGATDGCQTLAWAASNGDQVVFQTPLPPDLDDAADLVLHVRIKSAGTTDAVGFTVDSFFDEGDTKVVDTTATNQTATWAEKIATIGAADVPSGAQTLTIGLTPGAHTTDIMYLSAVRLEYKRKLRTS
jgi:hypothetical protein